MDTAAVIARRPAVVLVDELAHTNIPGTDAREALAERRRDPRGRHRRHLDRQRPALREPERHRLRDHRRARARDAARLGARSAPTRSCSSTSPPTRCSTASSAASSTTSTRSPGRCSNFFRRGNLVALRELALRKTAEEVDESLESYLDEHEIDRHRGRPRTGWSSASKRGSVAKKLVRRGYRLAKRLQGHFWVVHVHTPGETLGGHQRELRRALRPGRELGGAGRRSSSGDSEADAILEFAREKRATFIVMGQSKRSRLEEVRARFVADRQDHARDRLHRRAGRGRPEQGGADAAEAS